MTTRLERLFVLLSSASTPATRSLAARQLGNIIKAHPRELDNLLTHLHPLMRSTSWETRVAAKEALEAILEALPPWNPLEVKVEMSEVKLNDDSNLTNYLTFEKFDLEDILDDSKGLHASQGQEYQVDEDTKMPNLSDQQKGVKAQFGLDLVEKFGVASSDDIISPEDLMQTEPSKSSKTTMSSRERNKLKRTLSKQKSQQLKVKKEKMAPKLYKAHNNPEEESSALKWPLQEFISFMLRDIFESNWETRHGAAMAIREIVRLQGNSAGMVIGVDKATAQALHEAWLENVGLSLVSVIARDCFGDFVSDQVVAPVKESAAQGLGSVITLMKDKAVIEIVKLLLHLLNNESWHRRHGGMLGLKYILAVRIDMTEVLLELTYNAIFARLKDEVEDVVGVAASTLQHVVHGVVKCTPHKIDLNQLLDFLWDSLKVVDELASSTESIMQLLAEILKQQLEFGSLDENHQIVVRVSRLFPFLSHSSSNVRRATLSTLSTLTSNLQLSQSFLSETIGPILTHLMNRALLEHQDYNLKLIENIWNNACDNTPLGPLLMGSCPLYGNWISLLMQPPNWPLPQHLLIKPSDNHQYLGGPHVQQVVDPIERDFHSMQARHLGVKMLGKLAGFIVQPVPGMDYSQDTMPPMAMFISKIILPNLNTQSAYARLTLSLVVSEWCNQHGVPAVPNELKCALTKFLVETVTFDEIIHGFSVLKSSTLDLIALLKHHKLRLPDIVSSPDFGTLEHIKSFLFDTDFKAVVSTNPKLKSKIVQEILERVDETLKPGFNKLRDDQESLSVKTLAAIAGAVMSLEALPDKLNPVIKPLMESIKREPNLILQQLSCNHLARVIEVCVERQVYSPLEKVLKNLIAFAAADPNSSLNFQFDATDESNNKILTLSLTEAKNQKDVKKGRPSSANKATLQDPGNVLGIALQARGAKLALETVVHHFHQEVFEKLPKLKKLTIDTLMLVGTDQAFDPCELLFALKALEIIISVSPPFIHSVLITTLPRLFELLKSNFSSIRHMASICIGELGRVEQSLVITGVLSELIPLLESEVICERQGAVEAISWVTVKMDTQIIPFIVLLMVPILGRMSDQNDDVRLMATNTFAALIKLYPLEGSVPEPPNMSENLLKKKKEEKSFMNQLMDVKSIENYPVSIKLDVSLRKYQTEGINWLGFLNRYKIHGILCDDMGLGKTLQTICIIANDHFLAQQDKSVKEKELPSLIICPPTLCPHWNSEIQKFLVDPIFKTLVYAGPASSRVGLRKFFPKSNLIICSYDVVRNDIDMFVNTHWNYIVLDEGQVIKNGKTKTTLAIKSLKSKHRLVLSGTPIQNSVLELWSLFDFLMPGYLGSEKQFASKYSRKIIASRDPKCSSKEQEAGALAMEALHKQILPFVLRRMKEDVLKDLPPKITQDFYCDLSPIQVKLYEDFAKKQSREQNDANPLVISSGDKSKGKTHIFQALQYLRKVCNHPKLVLDENHQEYDGIMNMFRQTNSSLDDINHSAKLPALRDLLLQCGIGVIPSGDSFDGDIITNHRALIFFQLKSMMDIVEKDLLKRHMPSVTYLRLDGSVPANARQKLVDQFNSDASIDVLLISTAIGGLGLNLTGADTVIFVEHDWNPMKDLQAMDRAHRIGQKRVVNVYRLITKSTIEEKIMGLQKFKLKTANTVISADNSSLPTMATNKIFDLFSLNNTGAEKQEGEKTGKKSLQAILDEIPELWDEDEYSKEFDMSSYVNKHHKV